MPIYSYQCKECGEATEVLAHFGDFKKRCTCGGELKQVFSPFTIFIGKAPQSFHNKFAGPHKPAVTGV